MNTWTIYEIEIASLWIKKSPDWSVSLRETVWQLLPPQKAGTKTKIDKQTSLASLFCPIDDIKFTLVVLPVLHYK